MIATEESRGGYILSSTRQQPSGVLLHEDTLTDVPLVLPMEVEHTATHLL